MVWDGLRTPLREVTAGGGLIDLEMAVRLPDDPGDYLFQPDLVCPGASWFSTWAGDRFPRYRVTVAESAPGAGKEWMSEDYYRAAVTGTRLPAGFPAGEETVVTVTLENRGPATWATGGLPSVRLSYHWLDPAGQVVVHDGLHTALPGALGPGETADIEMRIGCPAEPGAYTLELDLLCEGVNWFAEVSGAPLKRVAVNVS